jgi:hypothetical protein
MLPLKRSDLFRISTCIKAIIKTTLICAVLSHCYIAILTASHLNLVTHQTIKRQLSRSCKSRNKWRSKVLTAVLFWRSCLTMDLKLGHPGPVGREKGNGMQLIPLRISRCGFRIKAWSQLNPATSPWNI